MSERTPRPKVGERLCDRVCVVDGCAKPGKSSGGYCGMHTERLRAHGSIELPPRPTLAARIQSHVSASGDCWMWQGRIDPNGYPRLGGNWAHRLSYEATNGPIPDGLELDHLCRTPACVNPAHLEPVTPRVNMHRGMSPSAIVVRTNRCHRGHEFTPENTYVRPDTGHRQCLACIRLRRQRSAAA